MPDVHQKATGEFLEFSWCGRKLPGVMAGSVIVVSLLCSDSVSLVYFMISNSTRHRQSFKIVVFHSVMLILLLICSALKKKEDKIAKVELKLKEEFKTSAVMLYHVLTNEQVRGILGLIFANKIVQAYLLMNSLGHQLCLFFFSLVRGLKEKEYSKPICLQRIDCLASILSLLHLCDLIPLSQKTTENSCIIV